MSAKLIVKAGLAVLIVTGLSLAPAAADWTCSGTITYATADISTSPGQTCGGDYTNTHVSDDSDQCLQETGNPSHLTHLWEFDNVPNGVHSLIWEGHRPSNSDGDNFQFSAAWIDPITGVFYCFPRPAGAVINKVFDFQGGTKTALSCDTDETYTWNIYLSDTANGASDDSVYVDFLAICTE